MLAIRSPPYCVGRVCPNRSLPASLRAKGFAALARLWPGAKIKRRNQLALREYEDLVRWARDDLRDEATALEAVRQEARDRGLRGGGLARQGERPVRARFAQRWRDRKSQSERKIEDLHNEDNFIDRVWRRIFGPDWPENPYQEEIERLSHAWEEVAQHEGI